MWMRCETQSKVESCRRNPMHFADATKNRSDDVKQWNYERKRDLDALMSCHQVKGAGEQAPLEQPWTVTTSEEQVSGNTVLLLRIVAEKLPPDVEESDRQAKRSRSDVSELCNLERQSRWMPIWEKLHMLGKSRWRNNWSRTSSWTHQSATLKNESKQAV